MQSTTGLMEGYFLSTTKAVGILFSEELYSHSLIIIFSTIDACGLLDALADQTSATRASFTNWVKKYLLKQPGIEFNEIDLWGARCSILHTFTSESDLSKSGKARELVYYSGEKSAPHVQQLVSFTKTHESGKYLAVHYDDLCEAFFQAIKTFVPVLDSNCESSQSHVERLRKIMQMYPYQPTS